MTDTQKAERSRARGRFTYVIFDRNGEEYSATAQLLTHAIGDAKACGGEIWKAGRCVVPAWNV